MRYVLENVEAGKLSGEMKRRGVAGEQRVRAVVEVLDESLPLASMAEAGRAFEFLADEPEIYSEKDLRSRNV
jgi:hypothetical protein